MDPFNYDGVFWRADEPSQHVTGYLRYDPANGSVLSLIGNLSDLSSLTSSQPPVPFRINGFAGGKRVTLENCIIKSFKIDGIERSEYFVGVVLSGINYAPDQVIESDDLLIEFDQLSQWVDRRSFSIAFETATPNPSSPPSKITLDYQVQPTETMASDGVDVSLEFVHSIAGDRLTEMKLGQRAQLRLKYPHPRSLREIQLDVRGLQDLITLAVDAPTVPTRITLKSPGVARDAGSDDTASALVDLYPIDLADPVKMGKPQDSSQIFFRFNQIGGLATIGRWISVSRHYRQVLGFLLTIRYSASLYEENRFSNVLSAAEAFHRMRFPGDTIMPKANFKSYRRSLAKAVKRAIGNVASDWLNKQLEHSNEVRLVDRLSRLAEYAGSEFAEIVGNVDTWAPVTTLARNRLTHHDDSQPFERNAGDLQILSDSVYILVMLCLFRECEVPSSELARVTTSSRISWLRGNLEEVIARLSVFLRKKKAENAEPKSSGE